MNFFWNRSKESSKDFFQKIVHESLNTFLVYIFFWNILSEVLNKIPPDLFFQSYKSKFLQSFLKKLFFLWEKNLPEISPSIPLENLLRRFPQKNFEGFFRKKTTPGNVSENFRQISSEMYPKVLSDNQKLRIIFKKYPRIRL